MKPPTVLPHVLLAPQLWVPLTHSLMSIVHRGPSNLQNTIMSAQADSQEACTSHEQHDVKHKLLHAIFLHRNAKRGRCIPCARKTVDAGAAAGSEIGGQGWLWQTWLYGLPGLGVEVVHILADEAKCRVVVGIDSIQPFPCMAAQGFILV